MPQHATYSVKDLKRMLRERQLRTSGNKAELLARLATYDSEHPFPFLKLPAEIRNEIYSYAANFEDALQKPKSMLAIEAANQPHHLTLGDMKSQASISQPALFRTCSQVYQESRALFYRYHKFKLHIWPERKSLLDQLKTALRLRRHLTCFERVWKWLDTIGVDMQRQIRSLEIELEYIDSQYVSDYVSFMDTLHAKLADQATVIYRPASSGTKPSDRVRVLWGLGKRFYHRDSSRVPHFEHPRWTLPRAYAAVDEMNFWAWTRFPLVHIPSRGRVSRPSLTFGPGKGWFGGKPKQHLLWRL